MSKFQKSDLLRESTLKKFNFIKDKIVKTIPWIEIKPIGGSFVPGALTKGDVDLLVRVEKNRFFETLDLLRNIFQENNREIWDSDFAIFKDEKSFNEKIDILVTIIGTNNDLKHSRATEFLSNNKEYLDEYNQLKSSFTDSEDPEYKAAKRKFYEKLEPLLK
jgi:GrpB-like predicted nucleotidyltransferase (UPF0157 family)